LSHSEGSFEQAVENSLILESQRMSLTSKALYTDVMDILASVL